MSRHSRAEPKNGKITSESKLDELERRLREKVNVATGFADDEVKVRKLKELFKFFDTDDSGFIDPPKFNAAMVKLNFVGVQREIESLFNRYDDDASGTIDYKEFAYHLFGLGGKPQLDGNSKNIVEKVKARIINQGGASGFHGIKRILARMDTDGNGVLDHNELLEGLRQYGIFDVSATELETLFNYFDRDRTGRISAEKILKGLQVKIYLKILFVKLNIYFFFYRVVCHMNANKLFDKHLIF